MANSAPTPGGVWVFFVLAMIPILIALVVPALPELVTRLETIKIGGFEATLYGERLAAGAGATALVSERSAGDGYSEVAAWIGFAKVLEVQAAVASHLPEEESGQSRIESSARLQRWLIEPIASVVTCQSRLGIGALRLKSLLGDLVIIMRIGAGMSPPSLVQRARMEMSGHQSGVLMSLRSNLRDFDSLQNIPGVVLDDECMAGLANLRLAIESISYPPTEQPSPDMLTFSDNGYLTMFVAALMSAEGDFQGRTGALRIMGELLKRDFDAKFLSPFERMNLLFLYGRAMRQGRWEADHVIETFNEALETAKQLRMSISRSRESCNLRRYGDADRPPRCTVEGDEKLLLYASYLEENFEIRILSELVAVYVQYMHEGIPVGDDRIGRIEHWQEILSQKMRGWTFLRSPPPGALSPQEGASALINAAVASVLLAERKGTLDRPLCASSDASIASAEDIWREFASRSGSGSTAGAAEAQAPLVLVQKYRSFVQGVCESGGF